MGLPVLAVQNETGPPRVFPSFAIPLGVFVLATYRSSILLDKYSGNGRAMLSNAQAKSMPGETRIVTFPF
jgi:hypothetical protein